MKKYENKWYKVWFKRTYYNGERLPNHRSCRD